MLPWPSEMSGCCTNHGASLPSDKRPLKSLEADLIYSPPISTNFSSPICGRPWSWNHPSSSTLPLKIIQGRSTCTFVLIHLIAVALSQLPCWIIWDFPCIELKEPDGTDPAYSVPTQPIWSLRLSGQPRALCFTRPDEKVGTEYEVYDGCLPRPISANSYQPAFGRARRSVTVVH